MGKLVWNTWLPSPRSRRAPTLNLHWVPEMGWWTEWFGRCNHGYVSTWYVLWCRGWRKGGAHVYMGQQFDNLESTFLCEVYIKRISSNQVAWPSLLHTIFACVSSVSIHVVYIRVYIHIVLKICSGSSHASHLDTTIKFDWTNFFSSVIPRVTVSQLRISSCQPQLP